jgi:hypothetical protein
MGRSTLQVKKPIGPYPRLRIKGGGRGRRSHRTPAAFGENALQAVRTARTQARMRVWRLAHLEAPDADR